MQRRTFMRTVGGIGAATAIGGAGIAFTSGGAAASTIDIEGGNPSVSNDRGDLSELTVDPQFTVEWENFDDVVGKIFFLLEASVDGGEYMPIYRATPWLSAEQMGTTGSFTRPGSWNGGLGPLVVADEQGKPNYDNINFPGDSIDKESYLDGTSLGSADSDWYVNAPFRTTSLTTTLATTVLPVIRLRSITMTTSQPNQRLPKSHFDTPSNFNVRI